MTCYRWGVCLFFCMNTYISDVCVLGRGDIFIEQMIIFDIFSCKP